MKILVVDDESNKLKAIMRVVKEIDTFMIFAKSTIVFRVILLKIIHLQNKLQGYSQLLH